MEESQEYRPIEPDASGFRVRYADYMSCYTPRHWHKALELVLMLKGTITYIYDSGERKFKSGMLFLINSHEVHGTRCSRYGKALVVHIDPNMMARYCPAFDQLLFSLAYPPEQPEYAEAFQALHGQMEQLHELTENTATYAPLERQSCLFRITALLVKYFSRPLALEETNLRRSDMSRLEPLLEYIQLHHSEELTLDAAADFMGLNKEYFCRLFKKNMGITHLQYVYQVRSAAVCRDLENTDDPIGLIAERHGFHDGKTLNQYFKELYGCTPSEKRKQLQEVSAEDIEE